MNVRLNLITGSVL